MATHSGVLAWRIPGTGEPGGLPSMGSHRVGHDRSDLAQHSIYIYMLQVIQILKYVNLPIRMFVILELSLGILFFFFLILFLNFTVLYLFCQISKWIRHRYTCVPHPEPSSLLPPHTIPLGHPSAPAPSIQYGTLNLDWQLISYRILYVFQCHSPKSSHPLPLPQSP